MPGRGRIGTFVETICVWGGLGLILWPGGCMRLAKKTPGETCPGKAGVQAALSTLRSHMSQVRPLYMNGECRLCFIDQTDKKRKYSLPVKLWLEPPFNLYLLGQPPVGPRGAISLGSNQGEFWLSVKPDINTLWWGTWDEASRAGDLKICPRVVLEALGMVDLEDPNNWRLENRDGQDVLTEVDATGSVVKRIIVNTCDYRVYRISYFDESGAPTVVVNLDGYVTLNQAFALPTQVGIDTYLDGQVADWFKLTIPQYAIKEKVFSERQRERLFTRPQADRYDSVIHVTDAGPVQEK